MATNRPAADPSLLEDKSLRAEVQFLAAVTPENEVAIRTLHRTLGACRHVEVHKDYHGKEIWVIQAYDNTIRLQDIHAGDREIHITPSSEVPPVQSPDLPTRPINETDQLSAAIAIRRSPSNFYPLSRISWCEGTHL